MKQKVVEYEEVEQTSLRTLFECCNNGCGTVLEWVPYEGCPKCKGNVWQTRYREIII